MYATRKLYVKQWEHESPDERYSVTVTRGGKPVRGIQPDRISAIDEEVMYWRKANHIHAWFVDNVQNEVDNCASYYVSEEKLRELFDTCQKVIEASKLVEGQIVTHRTLNEKTNTWEVQRAPGMVIEDTTVAKALLPVREGFFFGSTDYNEYYLNDVVETRDFAERILSIQDGVPGSIYYHSSW